MMLLDVLSIVAITIMMFKATTGSKWGLGGDILAAVLLYGSVKWSVLAMITQQVFFNNVSERCHYIAGGFSLFVWSFVLIAAIRKRKMNRVFDNHV